MTRTVALIIASLFISRGLEAKERTFHCPESIEAGVIKGAAPHPGWQLYNRSKLVLRSAAFIDGAPEKMVDLVPVLVSRKNGREIERWKFEGGEIWLRCAYGAGGQITLSKKIESELTECTVSYNRNQSLTIVCT